METMTYLQLLTKIENKQINPYNYNLLINDTIYHYNGFEFVDKENTKFISRYIRSESDLIHLKVFLQKKDKFLKTQSQYEIKKLRKAKGEIMEELWDLYLSLDWELDICQGCTSDLDMLLEKLKIYKRLLEYMGCCVDKDKDRKSNEWYSNEIKKQKEKEEQENKQIEPLWISWRELTKYNNTPIEPAIDLYRQAVGKINDITTYLRNKDNKEKEKDK